MDASTSPKEIFRQDYKPLAYSITHTDLHFDLGDDKTTVSSTLTVKRNGAHAEPLVLAGERLGLKQIKVDGRVLTAADYTVDAESLTIPGLADNSTVEIVTEIDPKNNTSLEGLYQSGSTFCTQCEPHGFRKITYYLDRPDNLATFKTTIVADKARFPILLGNGNKVAESDLGNGRHSAVWVDPFPKPSYLFALVGANLAEISDTFTTMTGKQVRVAIFTEFGKEEQGKFGLEALKRSMKWDEDAYGREYDLDVFNIVAVSDFNFGAMENKSLNIFNSSVALAHPSTQTDGDFHSVERVIGHEYFHNWSGNRVTCRDWFQLSLKEGFTVLRDQEFSSAMGSPAVQRISDVKTLRAAQFTEDAGPMSHPIRPESYISMNNFYTSTVYKKGAEVVRMYRTIMGDSLFRKATDLYFTRHDGQAATCDDFLNCMAETSGRSFDQFKLWYSQAGTPEVEAEGKYDARTQTYRLTLRQTIPATPGQAKKQAMHIPVRMGLIGVDGKDIPLQLQGEAAAAGTTRVIELTNGEQEFVFTGVKSEPVPSLFRGFSAPVKLASRVDDKALLHQMSYDSDSFNRWDAGQTLASRVMLRMIEKYQKGQPLSVDRDLIDAFGKILKDPKLDNAMKAEALILPAFSSLAQQMKVIDPDAIDAVRKYVRQTIASRFRPEFDALYTGLAAKGAYQYTADEAGRRALRNLSLSYLAENPGAVDIQRAKAQYDAADNMTDRMAAMGALNDQHVPEREAALQDFYNRFKDDKLATDKWFSVQAYADRPDALQQVQKLMQHPDFTLKNPNRLSALVGAFAASPTKFHAKDGSGYKLVADTVIAVDGINAMSAARLVAPFRQWRRYDDARQAQMKAEMERILQTPKLSPNVYELLTKTLAPPPAPPANGKDRKP